MSLLEVFYSTLEACECKQMSEDCWAVLLYNYGSLEVYYLHAELIHH